MNVHYRALLLCAAVSSCGGDSGTAPRTPAALAAVSNTSVDGVVAQPVAVAVRVTANDRAGLAGVSVTFAVTAGGGLVSPASAITDDQGRASAQWTLGTAAGGNALQATAGALPPVVFTAAAKAGAPANVTKEAGDNQTTVAGGAVPAAPSVRVTDQFGNNVAGASVTFAVASGGGSVAGSAQVTDASGLATVGGWTVGPTAGENAVTATVVGLPLVTFSATGVPGPPSRITKEPSSDNQVATVGTTVPVPPTVFVTDQHGNPTTGAVVTFSVVAGGGSITGATQQVGQTGAATVGSWTLGTAAGPNTLAATVDGLPPQTFSATAAPPPPPPAPTSIGARANSSSEVLVFWTQPSTNADGFKVERCAGAGCASFAEVATVTAGGETNYLDKAVSPANGYSYRVRAFNAGGHGPYSATASVTTPAVPPAAPIALTVTATSGYGFALSWTDASSNEDAFRIHRCAGTGCTNFSSIAVVGPNITSHEDAGLSPATTYRYAVRAENSAGVSEFSNVAEGTTPPDPPSAPSGLTASPTSSSQIRLAWQDNSGNEDGFLVERCVGSTCTDFVQIASVAPNAVSYEDTGLSAGTTYRYRVRAHNAGGNSASSNTATASTHPNPPAAPTSLTATAVSSSEINVSWTDASDNEGGFRIEQCMVSAGTECSSFTEVAATPGTTYPISGLQPSTRYCFRVRAFNTGGSSPYTSVACATTRPTLPAAPNNLTATASSASRIDLTWADNATNEDGYAIERCSGPTCTDFIEITTVGPNVVSYSNAGLVLATAYRYRVRARNVAGSSQYSNVAGAETGAVVVAAVGDIARCYVDDADEVTAALVDAIVPDTVLALGDNAYEVEPTAESIASAYTKCFEESWGRHKARTRPAPGNHEYMAPDAPHYYEYFGEAAGPAGRGYYSFDVGGWHVISLNSNVAADASSPQMTWLRADLAKTSAPCVIAFWHHPVFSSGLHGNNPHMAEVWRVLDSAGVDVALVAHDHNYERFAPQDHTGRADPNGIRQFVVGTGGGDLRPFGRIRATSEARASNIYGVLKLTLRATGYDWEFVPAGGASFRDTGTSSCVDP